ncbi:MAG: glucose-6-phosphate isomerase [Desulfococcaceae bacterium]
MATSPLTRLPVWRALREQARKMEKPDRHLRHLLSRPGRLTEFSASGGGLFLDYSRQRIDSEIRDLLIDLAEVREARGTFSRMMEGEPLNVTESRSALHTATRHFGPEPIRAKGADVMPDIRAVRDQMAAFAAQVHGGGLRGSTGKRFRHVVVVGIGRSYLGAEFVAHALEADADRGVSLHFLANVDIHHFGSIVGRIDPEATLWLVVSKSYTTAETLANTRQIYAFLAESGLEPARHVATVTSQGSPGDDPANPVAATFHMFDYIGGRYSVCSAVGGVPLSLYLGWERFESFLRGAEEMDRHARDAAPAENLPLMAALTGIWNNNFLGYPALAIIPYAEPLNRLASHVQQLYMESNGKRVTAQGDPVDFDTGVVVFGEPGTNAQHSFFQLAHQGRPFPIEFIGVLRSRYPQYNETSLGVTNHQELWANLLSQPMALALGRDHEDPARRFPGNRPSSTLLLTELAPKDIGRLLSFYEARTVFEAFIWGVNPFDQFGVELGKTMAKDVRQAMARRNETGAAPTEDLDPYRRFYLERLWQGALSEEP